MRIFGDSASPIQRSTFQNTAPLPQKLVQGTKGDYFALQKTVQSPTKQPKFGAWGDPVVDPTSSTYYNTVYKYLDDNGYAHGAMSLPDVAKDPENGWPLWDGNRPARREPTDAERSQTYQIASNSSRTAKNESRQLRQLSKWQDNNLERAGRTEAKLDESNTLYDSLKEQLDQVANRCRNLRNRVSHNKRAIDRGEAVPYNSDSEPEVSKPPIASNSRKKSYAGSIKGKSKRDDDGASIRSYRSHRTTRSKAESYKSKASEAITGASDWTRELVRRGGRSRP